MTVKARNKMPSQFPALRITVAQQMAGYQERLAKKMRAEASKRGESAVDLASNLGTSASTAERWLRGERVPQRRNQKELREYWKLDPDFFEIDLEAEEKEVRAQLDRIEEKLDELLGALAASAPEDKDAERKAREEAEQGGAERKTG